MAAVLVLSAGCGLLVGSQVQTRNYYMLSYTPATQFSASSLKPYNYSLQIGRFEVQRIFNRQNILYRYSPHQIQYYELQQWAVRPDQMFADLVLKHIEVVKLVRQVGADFFDSRPDFRLDGVVEALEKFDSGDLFFAHLAMSFKLLRVSDGVQVWDYSFDKRRQVFQPEMVYTVRGLSAIFESEMNVVAGQLDSLFLVIDTGASRPDSTQVVTTPEAPQSTGQPPVKMGDGVDESTFEIIPEKQ